LVTAREPPGATHRTDRAPRSQHRAELRSITAEHGVDTVGVFGSVARGEDSVVDLLVDMAAKLGLVGLGRLADELEALLGARVDLVPLGARPAGLAPATS
jgi:predicted nucleotidyltransferase